MFLAQPKSSLSEAQGGWVVSPRYLRELTLENALALLAAGFLTQILAGSSICVLYSLVGTPLVMTYLINNLKVIVLYT
ncbi:hypothetical protein [Vibrio sp. C8]